jgi:hypothetical protein
MIATRSLLIAVAYQQTHLSSRFTPRHAPAGLVHASDRASGRPRRQAILALHHHVNALNSPPVSG